MPPSGTSMPRLEKVTVLSLYVPSKSVTSGPLSSHVSLDALELADPEMLTSISVTESAVPSDVPPSVSTKSRSATASAAESAVDGIVVASAPVPDVSVASASLRTGPGSDPLPIVNVWNSSAAKPSTLSDSTKPKPIRSSSANVPLAPSCTK